MLENKIINKIIQILIIFIIMLNFNIKVYADAQEAPQGGSSSTATNPITNTDFFKPDSPLVTEERLTTRVGNILGVINTAGVIVSVITLMVIGVKYMLGSVEEKAEYKKTAIMYLIGAGIIFSTTTIPNILYKLASNI